MSSGSGNNKLLALPKEVNNQLLLSSVYNIEIYSFIFEHYPDGVFTLDQDGNFLHVNQKTIEILGYLPEEMKGSFIPFVREECLSEVLEHFQLALNGEPRNYHCEAIHRNGHSVQLNITNIPILSNGDTIGVFGIAKNLTELNQKESELLQITESLNLAQEVAKIGSWDYDVRSNYVYCSDPLYQILGIGRNHCFKPTYENLLAMICEEDRARFDYFFKRTLNTGEEMDLEYTIQKSDHSVITVHVRAIGKKDKQGKVTRIIGILYDISAMVTTQNRLKEAQEKFETITKNLEVGIYSLNILTNKVDYVSHPIEKFLGPVFQDVMDGRIKWEKLIHPEDIKEFQLEKSKLFSGEMVCTQYRIIGADAKTKWIEDKRYPVLNSEGELVRLDGFIQDISERKQNEEKINYIAYHDYLTGLPNRRMFDQKLEQVIEDCEGKNQKFTLFYIDLDRFKFVNDTLGHDLGDALLCEVANRLISIVGEKSIFRIGGDEFTFIHRSKDTYAVASKIIREIKKPFQIEGYDIHMTTSIGISVFPDDGKTLQLLKMNADTALYRAKELGKNNFQLFNKSFYNESYKLFSMENDLRKAIPNEEFTLYFQSRVDSVTGEIVGAEALIRWNHPAWGLVPPLEFIPLAEEIGLINEISYWVIQQVCKQLKDWTEQGIRLVPVSVNLPVKTLMKADLIVKVKEILSRYSVPANLLEVEITEDSLMSHEGDGLSTIRQLREMGIAISIDDFGTGYSSIAYLKKFKVDYLKIDRSFIKEIHKNNEDLTIVQSIILLAKGFKLKVVAEGVETENQYELLQSLNCHYLQGYLFNKPMPAEEFTDLLRGSRGRF